MTKEQFWKTTLRTLTALLEQHYDFEKSKMGISEEQNQEHDQNCFMELVKAAQSEQSTKR